MAPKALEGFLDNGRGEPLADIPAVASRLSDGVVVDTTMTDDDGHWAFSGLPTANEYLVTLSDTSGNSVSRAPWSGEMRELWVRDRLDVAGVPLTLDPAAGNALLWSATGLYAPTGITLAAADLRYEPLDSAYTKAEADARYPQKTDIDPYPNYLTSTEADLVYVPLTGGSVLTGLLGPSTHNTRDLGTTALRWRALYGMTADLTTSLTVATKPVVISPDAANIVEWRANGFYAAAGAVSDIWVDVLGDTMTGNLNMAANVLPTTNNVRSLGSTSLRWLKVWATDADFTNAPTVGGAALLTSTTADALFLTPAEGNAAYATAAHNHDASYVQLVGGSVMTGLLGPTTTNTRDLGTTTLRWRKLWGVDADLSGALTVTTGPLTVSAGGIAVTGASTFSAAPTVGGSALLTTSAGDTAYVNATNDTMSGTLGVGGLLTASAGLAVTGAATVSTTFSINSRNVIMCGCRVYNTGSPGVTTNTVVALPFQTERYDTDNFHDNVTNNTRLTVPAGFGGVYAISGHIEWSTNADSAERFMAIRLNGTTMLAVQSAPNINSATYANRMSVTTIYQLVATDYVELIVRQQSGASLTIVAGASASPEFGWQRIG